MVCNFDHSSRLYADTTSTEKFQHKDHIASVLVTGVDVETKSKGDFLFTDVQPKVHAYTLHEQAGAPSTVTFSTLKDAQGRLINLPHESLAGVWEWYAVPA